MTPSLDQREVRTASFAASHGRRFQHGEGMSEALNTLCELIFNQHLTPPPDSYIPLPNKNKREILNASTAFLFNFPSPPSSRMLVGLQMIWPLSAHQFSNARSLFIENFVTADIYY